MTDFTTCANFFPEIEGGSSLSVENTVTGTGGCDDPIIVTPTIIISDAPGNSIVELPDGAYAASETLCYRVNFSHSSDLCVSSTCNTYELFKDGSVISFESGFISEAPVGSDIELSFVTPTGTVLATGTIAAGTQGVVFSGSPITITGDQLIGMRIDSVGATIPGCGLNVSALSCEPLSLFAPSTISSGGTVIESIDVVTGTCLTGTVTGTGTPLDPATVDLELRLDPDPTNQGECRPTGFYVAPLAVDETTTTLVDNGDGTAVYTNELGVPVTFPIGAGISNDACNELEERNGALYSPANPTETTLTANAQNTVSALGLAPVAGTAYQQVPTIQIVNNDPCGRDQMVEIDFYWGGVQARLSPTVLTTSGTVSTQADQLVVSAEWLIDGVAQSIGQTVLNGSIGTRSDRTSSSSFAYNAAFVLPFGSTRTISSRYMVISVDGVPTVEAFYANGFKINQRAIV